MSDLFSTFDALEPLIKAKAKTLDKWKKMSDLGEKLAGKSASDITFTSSHPQYEGAEVQHTLGSSVGNLHFLLGYVNPGFHVADYHWMLVDPFLTEEEAAGREHPANPEFWERSGLEDRDEGDIAAGTPHSSYSVRKEAKERIEALSKEAVQAVGGYTNYVGFPSQQVILDSDTGHLYSWDLFKDSMFSAENTEFADAMNSKEDTVQEKPTTISKALPLPVIESATAGEYSNVYPLVDSCFPKPGSILTMSTEGNEVYGVFGKSRVYFKDKYGKDVKVHIYDSVHKSLDLRPDGGMHPSVLLNFAVHYLNVDKDALAQFMESSELRVEEYTTEESLAN